MAQGHSSTGGPLPCQAEYRLTAGSEFGDTERVTEIVQGLPPTAPRPAMHAFARPWWRGGLLTWAALAVAALFAVPVISVLANIFVPSHGIWQHLVSTVLPQYLANTLWLVLGVGGGVLVGHT